MNPHQHHQKVKLLLLVSIKVFLICCLIYLFIPTIVLLPNVTNSYPGKGLLSLLCLVLLPILINLVFRSMIQDVQRFGLSRLLAIALIAALGFSSFSTIRLIGDWVYHHPSVQIVDYSNLAQMLNSQSWRAANTETRLLLLKVTNREDEGWLSNRAIETFPCTSLQTIDDLWESASDGRFGFGVQSRLWEKATHGQIESVSRDVQSHFFKQIGWQKPGTNSGEPSLNFSLQSPIGHLPSMIGESFGKACVTKMDQLWFGQSVGCFQKIFVRMKQCDRS